MLQFHVTDERGTVTTHTATAREFPLTIGRSAHAGLRLNSAGVWEQHARIFLANSSAFPGQQRFIIESLGQTIVSINGSILPTKELSVGDEILIGATRLTVGLAPARQKKFSVHDFCFGLLLFLVVITEAVLIVLAR